MYYLSANLLLKFFGYLDHLFAEQCIDIVGSSGLLTVQAEGFDAQYIH